MPAAADATPSPVRPPLHGVRVTVKGNVDLKGHATTNGVVAFKDNIAQDDSPVVANLRQAGAVVIRDVAEGQKVVGNPAPLLGA